MKKSLLLLSISLFGFAAIAQETVGEMPATSGMEQMKRNEVNVSGINGGYSTTKDSSNFGLNGEYHYYLGSGMQFGGSLAYYSSSYISDWDNMNRTSSSITVGLGPTFNFGSDKLAEMFYLRAMVEMESVSYEGAYRSNETRFYAAFGKRIKIFENVSYTPNIYTYFGADRPTVMGLNILSASALW